MSTSRLRTRRDPESSGRSRPGGPCAAKWRLSAVPASLGMMLASERAGNFLRRGRNKLRSVLRFRIQARLRGGEAAR